MIVVDFVVAVYCQVEDSKSFLMILGLCISLILMVFGLELLAQEQKTIFRLQNLVMNVVEAWLTIVRK